MRRTMPSACKREKPRTAWIDNIKMWTELFVEESIRMTEDRDGWRKYVHGVWPTLRSRMVKERNSIDYSQSAAIPTGHHRFWCRFLLTATIVDL